MLCRLGIPLLVSCVLVASAAWANAEDGLGVYVGAAAHRSEGEFTRSPLDGVAWEVESRGTSAGLDFQFALSAAVSLVPFLAVSVESAESSELIVDEASHTVLGVGLRYWLDAVFIGVHVGRYNEVLASADEDVSGSGFGYGVAAGWESGGDGLFVAAQLDRAAIEYDDAESDLTGLRAHVGWRFE